MPPQVLGRFRAVVNAAVEDLAAHGFDSQERLQRWLREIDAAARTALVPEAVLAQTLRDALGRVFRRTTGRAQLLRRHPGVSPFTLAQVAPRLRAELDRRILASADLIRLNREASIRRTLQRFAGWASSVPAGGSDVAERAAARLIVKRGIAALPFEERRVIVDQGHKLAAAVNEIIATDGGAIAGVWKHVLEANYDARPEHEARDGTIFVVRDNWALKDGLMKLAGAQYTDQIEQPGELVYCRCHYQFIYALRSLPERMLTAKGRMKLREAREQIAEMRA